MTITIPSTLKSSQLRSLAFQCGISVTGSKSILVERLRDEIKPFPNRETASVYKHDASKQRSDEIRILSIDMGIKNLAYCMLSVPATFPSTTTSAIPSISTWHRTSVLPSSAGSTDKYLFTPPSLAALTYDVLQNKLLVDSPTHILIERQRFRSMGRTNILEWTLRVNMFEAMLYASLHTLNAKGLWNGVVVSIAPDKVGPYFLQSKDVPDVETSEPDAGSHVLSEQKTGKTRNTTQAKLLNKGAKIDLVRSWLEEPSQFCMLHLSTEATKDTARQYLEKWHKPAGRPKKRGAMQMDSMLAKAKALGDGPSKLDDLADCLLQGVAFLRWEESKNLLIEKGVDAFDLTLEPGSNRSPAR